MATLDTGFGDMHRAIRNALGAHWKRFLFQGVFMIVLGVLAFVVLAAATLAVDIFVGSLLLISGLVGLATMFPAKDLPAFLWSLITAALSATAGVVLIWNPLAGVLTLTLLLAAFFIVEGVFQIVTSVAYREAMRGTWSWMLVSGIADLALAAIIILGWPAAATWTLGLLVGINLITSGWAIVSMALAGRGVAKAFGAAAGQSPGGP